MTSKFQLGIPKPCSKDFGNFKKTTDGGFCQFCQKEVVDFSSMTQHELVQYFKTAPKNICGRLSQSQIETPLYLSRPQRNSTRFQWLNLGLVGASVFSLLTAGRIQAQETKNERQQIELHVTDSITKPKKQHQVKGVVIEKSSGIPAAGITVLLKGTAIGTQTDFDGKFDFPELLKAGDILVFSSVGLKTKEVEITEEMANEMDIQLEENLEGLDLLVIGEVDVHQIYTSKPTLWQRIKGIFK